MDSDRIEMQLAELAANLRGKDWNLRAPQELADMIADKLDGIVAAYRSAQQAEAGAAGGFDMHSGEWNGPSCCGGKADCDVLDHCAGQPAASSAQEPGWVMVPVEPTDEMQYAGQQNFDGGSRWTRVGNIYRAMLAAAPARLAGAAQGDAPDCWAVLTPNGSRLVSPDEAKGRKDAYPLYAHPQAQVERKPLTDEQIDRIYDRDEFDEMDGTRAVLRAYARAIEAAHGIPTPSTASDEGSV